MTDPQTPATELREAERAVPEKLPSGSHTYDRERAAFNEGRAAAFDAALAALAAQPPALDVIPTAYRLSAMLEEMTLAGIEDPFDKRDREALARIGYVRAAEPPALDEKRLANILFRFDIGCEAHGTRTRHQTSDHREDAAAIVTEYARLARLGAKP